MAETVTTTFTANTAQLDAALQSILDRVGSLESKSSAGGAALESMGVKGASGIEKASIATNSLSGALDQVAVHTRTVALGLDAIGLEGAGAAAKVDGLVGALRGIGAAAPELLLIAAAVTAAFAAFNYMKDATKDAADLQNQMETLGGAVVAQGGNWDAAQESINKFLDVETMASGFTKSELVPALNTLVTAGNDVHDSQTILAVAEELARAKHIEVGEAVKLLISAEAGRAQGLVKLDTNLKGVVKSHGEMSTVLQTLHHDMGNAITDSDSYEMQQARLKVANEAVSETIGKLLLPLLTDIATDLIGAMHAASDFGRAIAETFNGVVKMVTNGADALGHFAEAMGDLGNGDFSSAAAQFKESGQHVAIAWQGATDALKGFKDMNTAGSEDFNATGHKIVNAGINAHNQALSHISLDHNGIMGNAPKHHAGKGHHAGSGTGYMPPSTSSVMAETPEDLAALTSAHNALANAKTLEDTATKSLTDSVNQSLDSKQLDAQKMDAEYAAYQKNITALQNLKPELDANAKSVQGARAAYDDARGALDSISKQIDAHNESLKGKTKLTAADKEETNQLATAHKNAELALKDADTQLKAVTKSMDAHEASAKKAAAAVDAWTKSQQQLVVTMNDAHEKALQAQADDEATHGLSLDQEIAYYTQKYNIAHAANEQFFADHHAWNAALVAEDDTTYQKMISLQTQQYNTQIDNAKKAQDTMAKDVSSYLDDIIVKHKSFADVFKSIWDKIVTDFIANIGKMIAEGQLLGSSGGGGLLGGILSMFGLGGATGGGAAPSYIIPGMAGTGMTQTGAALVSTTSGQAMAVHVASADSSLHLGGIASSPIFSTIIVGAAAAGIGNAVGNFESGGGPGNTHGANGAIGSLVAVGGLAALIGGGIGGMGAGFASILASGPAGWAIAGGAALLGGLAGGLFGHKDVVGNMPDKYNTQAWGQGLANLQGSGVTWQTMNANGQQFNEDGTLATQLGNKGELNYIGDYLKGGGKLDPALTALFQGLDSSVKRTIIDGHNGNLTLANGQQINWQDLLNKAQTALDQIQTNTATTAAAIPIFALTRMAPDFNTARLGTANPPTGGGGSGLVGGLPGTVQGAPIPGAGGAVRPPVIVNIHAPVVGSNGMQELADIIDKAQTRNQYYNHNNRGFNEN